MHTFKLDSSSWSTDIDDEASFDAIGVFSEPILRFTIQNILYLIFLDQVIRDVTIIT